MEFLSNIIGIVILVFLALCVYRTIISFIHEKETDPEIPVGEMTTEEASAARSAASRSQWLTG